MLELHEPAIGYREGVAIIHNPVSGSQDPAISKQKVEKAALWLQKRECTVEVYTTQYPHHATEIAEKIAREQKYSVVFAAGGDGIRRETAKALLHTHIRFAALPLGTVNVFATETRTPGNPITAVKRYMYNSDQVVVDTGEVNGEPFLLNAGAMMDAVVFRKVQEPGKHKKARGFLPYVIPTIQVVPWYEGVRGVVHIDDQEHMFDRFTQAWTSNTKQLGHAKLRPDAIADDGKHEFTLFTGGRGYQMVPHFLTAALIPGRGESARSVYRQGTTLTMELEKKVGIHADGDSLERSNVFQTRVVPDSLTVLVPRVNDHRIRHALFSSKHR